MTLVTLDLAPPRGMLGLSAPFAAVCAARGPPTGARCGPVRHYDDDGGNRADLHHLGDGRAVLVGHAYSETYFAAAAEYSAKDETDLLADAPDRWVARRRGVDRGRPSDHARADEDRAPAAGAAGFRTRP